MAFMAAVPEVAAAAEGAGAAEAGSAGATRGAPAAAGARTTAPGVRKPRRKPSAKAQQQRDAIQQIKDNRPPEPEPEETSDEGTKPDTGRPAAAPLFQVAPIRPASAGSGVVLGALAWVVAMNYMRGGVPQVRRLLAAKFLNKTEG